MVRETETTLVEVDLPANAGKQATYRLLYEGRRGPVTWPARSLRSRPAVIGRSASANGLQLDDPRVSRQHVKLQTRAQGLEVFFVDSSTNGTFVNGQRLKQGDLSDGDLLRVGDSFLLIRFLPEMVEDAPEVKSLVGTAPSISQLRFDIARVAPTDATVLIIGESGTGKELVARELHARSGRRGPFVAVNCSAIPQTLAESQLFGHGAGSFTGAKEHKGFFRAANGGTLFLDEIGELPLDVQPKLLRVLEERQVMPVGGVNPISVDLRIVVATNRELEDALEEGSFRGDLYARLAEITTRTPPLRDRREDILPLFALGYGEDHPRLSPELVEAMLIHSWPFNVRELFKVAKELRILGEGKEQLDLSLVKHRFNRHRRTKDDEIPEESSKDSDDEPDQSEVTRRYDTQARQKLIPSREQVEALLEETNGNVSELARRLQRSRRQIHRYLKMYNLDVESFRS